MALAALWIPILRVNQANFSCLPLRRMVARALLERVVIGTATHVVSFTTVLSTHYEEPGAVVVVKTALAGTRL